jgi:hypothetical protein
MISRLTILFGLVILVPLVASATTIILAVRALMRGQLVTKGRYLPARTIFCATQPVQFWSEIMLYLFCGAFLPLLGLMLVGHDPRWFHEIILQRATRHHGGIQH